MSLYIKNDETCRLARELAQLTGESMTGAITERCAKGLKPGPSAVEHGDLLYDERGLPK